MTPQLMIITEAASPEELRSLEELLGSAEPGRIVVQLRDRACSARVLIERARALRALTRASGQLFLVNDRLDVAAMVEADGVHLPAFGVRASDARELLGADLFLSRAVHDPEELSPNELSVLDALVISPVMAPRKGRAALGLPTFAAFMARFREANAKLGAYALGGVSAENAALCVAAGASGVAVMGAARDSVSARRLIEALGIAR